MKYGEMLKRRIEVYHSMGKNDFDISKILNVPVGSVWYIRKKVLGLPSVYDEPIAKCRVCGVVLNEINWTPSFRKGNHRVCKRCWNARVVQYHRRNPNWKLYLNEYQKLFSVHTGKGRIYGKKRKRTECCELCGRRPSRLFYHHWDDNNLMKGMWVCKLCHDSIHLFLERGLATKYLELKSQIDRQFSTKTQTTNTNTSKFKSKALGYSFVG
jgi:hypothetical protein